MSRENVELVRRLYDDFLSSPQRVFDRELLAFFDPAIEIRQSGFLVGTGGTYRGYDGAVRAARDLADGFRGLHFLPVGLADGGDHVVATVEARAYGKDSGVEVNETIAHLWRLEGGRVVAWHVYWDPSEALEAAGLREQP